MSVKPNFYYEIHFQDFEPSPAVREDIEKYLGKLSKLYDRIVSCTVVVKAPHRHGRYRYFNVDVDLVIPGHHLAVSRDPEKDDAHTDIHVAIRDAFTRLRRQLKRTVEHWQDHSHKQEVASGA
jgi:ribosomal subunit interface protein